MRLLVRALLLSTLGMLQAPSIQAGEFRLVDLERAEFHWQKLDADNRDPYAPQFTGDWRERAALDLRFGLLGGYGYWSHWIHTETISEGTVRTVGWKWEVGARLTQYLDVYMHHWSRHVMEGLPEPDRHWGRSNQFPVEDSIGIRFRLIQETHGRTPKWGK